MKTKVTTLLWMLSMLITACVPMTASAQWTVIDPTNLVQNTSTALSSVKTEVSTAGTYVEQLKANIQLVRSTLSMDGLADLTGMQAEMATLKDLISANSTLTSAIQQSQQLSTDVRAQFGASNFSWKSFLQSTSSNDLQRAQWLMDKFGSINKSIESAASRRQAIVGKLQDAQGATQATQAVGAAVDVVIGQNQQVISALGTQIANAAADKTEKVQAKQFSDDRYQQYQDSMKAAADKY